MHSRAQIAALGMVTVMVERDSVLVTIHGGDKTVAPTPVAPSPLSTLPPLRASTQHPAHGWMQALSSPMRAQ